MDRTAVLIAFSTSLTLTASPSDAQTSTTNPVRNVVTIELTLAEAETRAIDRNPSIVQARLATEIAEYAVVESRAVLVPVSTTSFEQRSQTTASTNQLTGGNEVVSDSTAYETGLSQTMPWGGGRLSLDFTNSRTDTTNLFSTFNPSYSASVNAIFTQPLLRGFRIDSARQEIAQAEVGLSVADVRLTRQRASTVAAVRRAYWELVYTTDALETAKRSEALAQRQVEENRIREQVGTLARIDVLQSEAEAATRRQATVQAEGSWRTAMVTLKQLIAASRFDPIWAAEVVAVDRPTPGSQLLDVDEAVRTALSNRTDVREARQDRRRADLSLTLAENERLWAVDFVAGYTATGVGGTQVLRESSGLGSSIVGTIPGSYLDALASVGGLDYPTWRVGLNVSVPLGTSRADASAASARVQQRQIDSQIQGLELQVAADVARAAERVRSAEQQVVAATTARQLAAQRLEAEDARLDVGLSTTFLLLQAQRDLATAETNELRASLDYRNALVDFELAQVAP